MTSEGQGQRAAQTDAGKVVAFAGALLLALDLALTSLLYERLPRTIAIHWSASGTADNQGDRSLAWLMPMCLGFVVALGLIARRRTKPSEAPLVAAATALGSLYLFSGSLLLLLANLDNQGWQQGSVAGRSMLLTLTLPALVFAAALSVYRARSAAR